MRKQDKERLRRLGSRIRTRGMQLFYRREGLRRYLEVDRQIQKTRDTAATQNLPIIDLTSLPLVAQVYAYLDFSERALQNPELAVVVEVKMSEDALIELRSYLRGY